MNAPLEILSSSGLPRDSFLSSPPTGFGHPVCSEVFQAGNSEPAAKRMQESERNQKSGLYCWTEDNRLDLKSQNGLLNASCRARPWDAHTGLGSAERTLIHMGATVLSASTFTSQGAQQPSRKPHMQGESPFSVLALLRTEIRW